MLRGRAAPQGPARPARRRSRWPLSRFSLAAIVLFAAFRGSLPFLASGALPAGTQRTFGTRLARMSLAGMPRSSSNQSSMPRVIVEMFEDEDKVNIAVPLKGKTRNLNRPCSEPLSKAIFRLRSAVAPPTKGKKAGGRGFNNGAKAATDTASASPAAPEGTEAQEPEIICELVSPETGCKVDETTLNAQAWQQGSLLRVGEEEFVVVLNPPCVASLRLPPRPLVGYLVKPSVELRFTSAGSCAWQWYRGRLPAEGDEGSSPRAGGRKMQWELIPGSTPAYSPQEMDVGAYLRVDCRAGGGDESAAHEGFVSAVTDSAVEFGPAQKAGEGRQHLTANVLGSDAVRLVSYNLLASAYADTSYAKTRLFPYVAEGALDAHYRLQLIVEELAGFNADVLCLQEVDRSAFHEELLPALADLGFDGTYLNKAGTVKEGEALFYRASKWSLAASKELELRKCFSGKALAAGGILESLHDFLVRPCNAELRRILSTKLTTVAQICCLVPGGAPGAQEVGAEGREGSVRTRGGAGGAGLVVINTHLFFHPGASHIRMLLLAAILGEAKAARDAWEAELGVPLAIVFAGDFNSEPDTGAIEFVASGCVSAVHPEWVAAAGFAWGDTQGEEAAGEEFGSDDVGAAGENADAEPALTGKQGGQSAGEEQRRKTAELEREERGVSLRHDLVLASCDALVTSFTNYVRGYIGCLDYIFYEATRLRVRQVVPLPPEDEVAHTALPSRRFPSDHLSLCCDLEFALPSPRSGDGPLAAAAGGGGGGEKAREQGSHTAPDRYPARMAERLRPVQPASPHLVYKGVAALQAGEVIAVPTDTVYGLAAAANDPRGVQRLFGIKGRAASKAIAVCLAEVGDVSKYGDTGGLPEGLLEALLPGPITLVLKRLPAAPVCDEVTAGLGTLALRVPGPDVNAMWKRPSGEGRSFCRALAAGTGALALTSANPSNSSSTVSTEEFRPLWPQLAYVFDGGVVGQDRQGSTIIDLTRASSEGVFTITRQGVALMHVLEVLQRFSLVEAPA